MPRTAKPPTTRPARPTAARYVQPKDTLVSPRIHDVSEVGLDPLPSWVAVPERLRGIDRVTLGLAWRLAGKRFERVEADRNGAAVVH